MKLGELLGAYQTDLPITPRHEKWLAENPNASYTELAKEFLGQEVGKPQRDRTKTFSASGHGRCSRERQFSYLGMPWDGTKFNTRTISIFHNGTWTHLRWQLAGLSAGWLAHAEVPARDDELMLSGTLDGICDNGYGLEIKSINSNGFNRVVTYGPKAEHKAQTDAYMLMTGIEAFSFIYENKDTQDYKEIVYRADQARLREVRQAQEQLAETTAARELYPVKEACSFKEGREYLTCPFKNVCLITRDFEHAEQIREERVCASDEITKNATGRVLRLHRTSSLPTA